MAAPTPCSRAGPSVSARSSSVCWRRPVPPVRTCRADAWNRSTHASTQRHPTARPARPGPRNLNRSFRRPSTEAACILSPASHANSNDAFRQSDPSIARCTVHCSWASCWARPCPWRRKRWMPSGWRGASTEGLPVDASHHAPAELIVSGNVTLRGGDVVADTDNTYAVPRQDQTVTGGSAALSAAQNMSVAGSMVLSGGQATAISDYQDYEVPERGAAGRGWRDDRANRRQSRGGRGPGRADGSRHGILRRGPYASARAGAASLEVGRNLSVGGDFVIDAAPVGVMLVSSGSGAARGARGYPGDGGRRRIRRGPPGIVRRSGPGGKPIVRGCSGLGPVASRHAGRGRQAGRDR